MGRIILGVVTVFAALICGYFFTRQEHNVTSQQGANNFMEIDAGKMGDDPIYSEEIKRNTALVISTGDQVNTLTRQLAEMKRERDDAQYKTDQALKKVEELVTSISELQENSDANASEALQQQLESKIQQVSESMLSFSKDNDKKLRQLEVALNSQRQHKDEPVKPEHAIPKQSNITYAYGVTAESGNSMVDSIAGAASDTAQGIGNFFSKNTTQQRQQNGKNQAQAVIMPSKKAEWETVFPVYTLPPNTVLARSTLITPIIGRVPLSSGNSNNSNSVTDPFYFKVEIGADNLAANGHKIPGIAKMIASGYSTGVREQSCVRGYIDSMTFIFIDGRIVTQGETSKVGSSNGDALGYLADEWGKPCIRGTYINNAKDYLKSRGAAAFLEAAAEGLSQSQTSYTADANGNYQAVLDGNVWSYVLGKGIGGSASEFADYVRDRTANAFDVVYVEQSKSVQIWLNKMLPIDYDSQARKIQYYAEPNATKTTNHYD